MTNPDDDTATTHDHQPIYTTHLARETAEPQTGKCDCKGKTQRHGTTDDIVQITCLQCGNHWSEQRGVVGQGQPFVPYTKILAAFDSGYRMIEASRRARYRPHPSVAARFEWWRETAINPLTDTDLFQGLDYPSIQEAIRLHRSEVCRQRFIEGNQEAIFAFVTGDAEAFDDPWVVHVREQWGRDGTPASLGLLNRLCTNRVASRPGVPFSRVQDDVRIYFQMLAFGGNKIDARVQHVMQHARVSRTAGYEIWTTYETFVRAFSDRCGGEDAARDFLQRLTVPR